MSKNKVLDKGVISAINTIVFFIPIFMGMDVRFTSLFAFIHGVIYSLSVLYILKSQDFSAWNKGLFALITILILWRLLLLYVHVGMVGKYSFD